MSFSIQERLAKIRRIEELKNDGLNTPRMFFLKYLSSNETFDKALQWADEIHDKDPYQIFNIRTYIRKGQMESLQTKHYTDIEYNELPSILYEANSDWHCMIDSETPDNGRLAGNAILFIDDYGSPEKYLIEYSEKEKRAMVRDNHNKSIEFMAEPINEENTIKIEPRLFAVIDGLKKFHKKGVIIEWTYFCKPAGVLAKPTVFWEYRRWGG